MWDIKTIKPDQVHEKMCELLETYNNSEKGLTDITKFHVEYEKIHPFQDGNGHTGRMILFRECLKNGIIPNTRRGIYRPAIYYFKGQANCRCNSYLQLLNGVLRQSEQEHGQESD